MLVIDDRTLKSINKLKKDENFKDVIEWLKMTQDALARKSILQKDTECMWTQGQAQFCGEILHTIESTEEKIVERKHNADRPQGPVA